jgi:hypothetical protein
MAAVLAVEGATAAAPALAPGEGGLLFCSVFSIFLQRLLLLCCIACCCCCAALLSLEIAAAAGLSFQSKLLNF